MTTCHWDCTVTNKQTYVYWIMHLLLYFDPAWSGGLVQRCNWLFIPDGRATGHEWSDKSESHRGIVFLSFWKQQDMLLLCALARLLLPLLCGHWFDHGISKLTTEQDAETPLHSALLPANYDGPKGVFWSNKQVLQWTDLNWAMPTFKTNPSPM